jgi:uncharacterized protein (TIGR03000 family)
VISVPSAAPAAEAPKAETPATPEPPAAKPAAKAKSPAKDSILRTPTVPEAPKPAAGGVDEPPLPPLPDDAAPGAAPPAKKAATGDERNTRNAPSNGTLLTVHVPAEAVVYINGNLTKTTGTLRRYVSIGLEQGRRYTYEVQAVIPGQDGQRADNRTVHVRAGQAAEVAFPFDNVPAMSPAGPVATSLTLRVPADAQVILAGNSTDATGTVRQFTTTGLAKGEHWDNYRVVVTVVRQGRPVAQEKSIRLTGGETQTLDFDFADERVATR